MTILDEINASASASAMNSALRAGSEAVSARQTVTFTRYQRVTLPFDGSVYWVRADLRNDPTPPQTVLGSLHLAFDKQQDESENYSRVAVTFTSEQDVAQNFDTLVETDILIGTAGQSAIGEQVANQNFATVGSGNFTTGFAQETAFPLRFAFSRLGFYQNAGIFHYSGIALYPHMASQIVDDPTVLTNLAPTVSNSLPFFLALNDYQDFYGFGNKIPLYPSMLAPANQTPPYGTVHVPPDATEALASTPYLDQLYGHYQLARDRVTVTLYGAGNDAAQTFLDCVLQRSRDYGEFGLMNCPIVRDEKSGQNDLSILAAKKTIMFEVSYLQTSARNIARQLILQAACTVTPAYPATWPLDPTAPSVQVRSY